MAGGQFVGGDQAERDHPLFEAEKPALVIGGGEIGLRRQHFERGASAVDGPQPGGADRALQRMNAPLPRRVEDGLVGFRLDRAEAVHPAHIVDRVAHGLAAGWGRPVPIMQSRVTISAS